MAGGLTEIVATYLVATDAPEKALQALCRGQSVGNPSVLTSYETQQFLSRWAATGKIDRVRSSDSLYTFVVRFPQANFGNEGVNYLLSVLMGGQCDIDLLQSCRLMSLELGEHTRHWPLPRYGITGLRRVLHVEQRPFLCGIIKPKIGLTPTQLATVVEQMADGGCDVIKEDEILANQYWCTMQDRLPLVAAVLKDRPILYLVCVTGDGAEVWKKARAVEQHGVNFGVHCNLWAGLGSYRDLRRHVTCPIFFQKSGDKVWTTGNFSITSEVLCQLVYLVGCDMAHVGMYGGYLAESLGVLRQRMAQLHRTLPSFSCGMTPPLATEITTRLGHDLMITSGGWIHGQAEGITPAVARLKAAILRAVEAPAV